MRMKGYTFTVSEPYKAGVVVTKAEAQALNDLRVENIQNNLRRLVSEAQDILQPGELIPQEKLDEIQAKISKYDQSYSFQEKHQPRLRLGDIEAEAIAVARELVEQEAQRAGVQFSEFELELAVAERATLPLVIEAARERVRAKRAAVSGTLQDLLE